MMHNDTDRVQKEYNELTDKYNKSNNDISMPDLTAMYYLTGILSSCATIENNKGYGDGDTISIVAEYYHDYKKHNAAYQKSMSPDDKSHMLAEAKQLAQHLTLLWQEIDSMATTPEEKQIFAASGSNPEKPHI